MWVSPPFRMLLVALLASTAWLCPRGVARQNRHQRNLEDVAVADAAATPVGAYYALIIGNSNYLYINKLQTPITDADAVGDILRTRYGFHIKVLHDATRMDILAALSGFRRTLPTNSNLLIYYAGHGFKDPDTKVAYWFPVDAQGDNNANWISASDISADISAIPSQHILIVSDSCYSGELNVSRDAGLRLDPVERSALIAKMMQHRSRTLLASGGNEPVADGGPEGHSIFAAIFLQTLREMNQTEFNASDIFVSIQQRVGGRSQQLPQYSSINNSGHDGGDFVFTRQQGTAGLDPTIPVHVAESVVLEEDQGEAVKSLLERYQGAFEQKDLAALVRVWPGMPEQARKGNAQFFEHASAIKMTYNLIDVTAAGPELATVRFSQLLSFTYNGQAKRVATPLVTMTLNKAPAQRGGVSWQIASVK